MRLSTHGSPPRRFRAPFGARKLSANFPKQAITARICSMALIKIMTVAATTLALGACTAIRSESIPIPDEIPRSAISHEKFDRVLHDFVDRNGQVDYARLKESPRNLNDYVALIAAVSPDSHPHLFGTREDLLAFWINAYNASVIHAVTAKYPIASVGDVGISFQKTGFFVQQRFAIGGAQMSLYCLENSIVRERFRDPRIHFALNCASASCPTLPNRAFVPATLEQRLDQAARNFVADKRNVDIDHALRVVRLSSIFDWYESDFTKWPEAAGGASTSLLGYIERYASPSLAAELQKADGYKIKFNDYDWSLNDRSQTTAAPRK